MNVIISSIELNFYLEEKILRGRNSEFFLFIISDNFSTVSSNFIFSVSIKVYHMQRIPKIASPF